jgi:uncharacterized protein YceH (UPF0502 family)
VEPDAVEIRVLGCLLEKQRTTPDAYPLSLNALRLACNQSTNRDPVVQLEETAIRAALDRLRRRGWTRLTSGAGSRAAKYRQLFDDALGLAPDQVAILCVLMLRGPQTPGELKQRTDRLHPFADLGAIHATLEELIARDLVQRLDRRPGQKEERYVQRLGGDDAGEGQPIAVGTVVAAAAASSGGNAGPVPAPAPSPAPAPAAAARPDPETTERLERLERQVADLRSDLSALREALGEPRE